jgi:DNA-binding winged helix-turn-helix (wHTH) protein/predicted ATPase
MNSASQLLFPPFCLDLANQRLWRDAQEIPLRRKTFAVLRYLVEHPDQLVTKAALLDAVWPETYVSEVVLTVCIRELRRALGDERKTPRFIATVHGLGYRFLPTNTPQLVHRSQFKGQSPQPTSRHPRSPIGLVGREEELRQLHNWLDKALNGERQLVFVTGEPGIGKTTVVEAFLAEVGASLRADPSPSAHLRGGTPTPDLWMTQGQCIEHYGAGEAYLPVLTALGQLCREPGGERLVELLSQQAPTCLAQLPALLNAADLEALQRKTQGATKERMLREIAEALEVITTERPLLLVLEDLHWSDPSSLDLLAFVARRLPPARLLILGTYRPVEMLSESHPLQRVLHELYAHQLGQELALRRLTESEVSAYMTLRFPQSVLPTRLGQVLQLRTGGNPLFLASLVQELMQREVLRQGQAGRWEFHGSMTELEQWTPESVRHVLARQREWLAPEEERVLEAASLAGSEFSAATVAAALETEVIQIEEHCGRLAEQQQFLRLAGISEWPDGTRAAQYGFLHALYQEFWHERVSVGHQQQWHRRMGERKEAAYGQRAGEIAAELALHFEQGREYRKAVRYLQQAAERAAQRSAYQEAITLLTKGLELLKALPATPERTQQELTLQLALGAPLVATKNYAAPEVERVYTRAQELCRQLGETPQLFLALMGLVGSHITRGQLQTARELAEQCLGLARSAHSLTRLMWVHSVLGQIFCCLGEFARAQDHLEKAIALYDPQKHAPLISGVAQDSKVSCLCFAALVLWSLGYPDQALKASQEALTLAQELSHPYSLAWALSYAAILHTLRRERQALQARAKALLALSSEQGFPHALAIGAGSRGWVLAEQGQGEDGIAQIRQGMVAYRATGAEHLRTGFFIWLATACGKVGQTEEGLTLLAEGLAVVDKTGERMYEAELYRLKGTLTLQSQASPGQISGKFQASQDKSEVANPQSLTPNPQAEAEAEACFLKAIEITRKQQAKSLELRAVMSLSRLWQSQGKQDAARQLLAEIYGWFTEGFDTKDLQEAKALLEELNHLKN